MNNIIRFPHPRVSLRSAGNGAVSVLFEADNGTQHYGPIYHAGDARKFALEMAHFYRAELVYPDGRIIFPGRSRKEPASIPCPKVPDSYETFDEAARAARQHAEYWNEEYLEDAGNLP